MSKVKVISAQDGGTLTESADILERWREYCETLYTNTDNDTYDLELGPAEPVPTVKEVKRHSNPQRAEKQQGQMAYQSGYSSWEKILWLRQCFGSL